MLDTKAQHHLMEDLTTAESDEPIQIPISPRLKTTQKNFFFFFFFFLFHSTYESSRSGICRFCRGETVFRWGSWLKAGLGTGLEASLFQLTTRLANSKHIQLHNFLLS